MAFSPVLIGSMPVRIPSPPALVDPPTKEGPTACPFKKADLIRQLEEESDFSRKLLQDSFERERELTDKLAKALSELQCVRAALKRKEKQNADLREGYMRLQANSKGSSERPRKAQKWADPEKRRDHILSGANALKEKAKVPVYKKKEVAVSGKLKSSGVYGKAMPNAPAQLIFEKGRERFVTKLVPEERPDAQLLLDLARKKEAQAAKIAPLCKVSQAPHKLAGLTAKERIELHKGEGSSLESILRRTEPGIKISEQEELRLASSLAPSKKEDLKDDRHMRQLLIDIENLETLMVMHGPLHKDFSREKQELQALLKRKKVLDELRVRSPGAN